MTEYGIYHFDIFQISGEIRDSLSHELLARVKSPMLNTASAIWYLVPGLKNDTNKRMAVIEAIKDNGYSRPLFEYYGG